MRIFDSNCMVYSTQTSHLMCSLTCLVKVSMLLIRMLMVDGCVSKYKITGKFILNSFVVTGCLWFYWLQRHVHLFFLFFFFCLRRVRAMQSRLIIYCHQSLHFDNDIINLYWQKVNELIMTQIAQIINVFLEGYKLNGACACNKTRLKPFW